MCACRGCYFLFAPDGAGSGRFRAVPEDIYLDPDFKLSNAQWDALQIPVSMAFFFNQSDLGRPAAFYPSPAGPTESLLPLETWDELVAANPMLHTMLPDVQALLVFRPRNEPQRCYLVPIDAPYQLVGLIRRYWKGFDGGEEAWAAIGTFFDALSARSRRPAGRARTMSDLRFAVLGARVEPYAVVPTLMLRIRIREASGAKIHAIGLKVQIQIESQRRHYNAEEEARLVELFGEPARWGDTLRTILWTHVGTMVSAFEGATEIDLPLQASYDFDVAAAKYFHALDQGDIPLLLQFSGSVFAQVDNGIAFSQVAWNQESSFPLPVKLWRDLMNAYYPDSAWLRLRRDVFDELHEFKGREVLTTWDETIRILLERARAAERETV